MPPKKHTLMTHLTYRSPAYTTQRFFATSRDILHLPSYECQIFQKICEALTWSLKCCHQVFPRKWVMKMDFCSDGYWDVDFLMQLLLIEHVILLTLMALLSCLSDISLSFCHYYSDLAVHAPTQQ